MILLNVLKIASIIGTILLAVFATRYDYKRDGRVTKYGKMGIIGILVFGSFSVMTQLVQYNDDLAKAQNEQAAAKKAEGEADSARARLKEENERQLEILGNTRGANDRLEKEAKEQQTMAENLTRFSGVLKRDFERQLGLSQQLNVSQAKAKDQMDQNFARLTGLTNELNKLTNENFSRMTSQVEVFDARVKRNIERLAHPLRKMSVSYKIRYDDGASRFSDTFAIVTNLEKRVASGKSFVDPSVLRRDQNLLIVHPKAELCSQKSYERSLCNHSEAITIFSPTDAAGAKSDRTLKLRAYVWSEPDAVHIKNLVERGVIDKQREPRIELTLNPDDKSLVEEVSNAPIAIETSSEDFTSVVDITRPEFPDDTFLAFPLEAGAHLEELTIHFEHGLFQDLVITPNQCHNMDIPFIWCRIINTGKTSH